MRSFRGVVAALVCLLALPIALLIGVLFGSGAELAIHVLFGVGFVFTAVAVFDFENPRWITWIGCVSIGALGVIFLLQGASQLLNNPALSYVAFSVLGAQPELWATDLFLLWCCATVLLVSHGMTRRFGLGVMALVVVAEVYSHTLRYLATTSGGPPQWLKLVLLLPFVWLLVESRTPRSRHAGTRSAAVAPQAPEVGVS